MVMCSCWAKPSSVPTREDEDCEEKRWKKCLSLMDRDCSYRAWLLGPQEKPSEGIVREYVGQREGSVSHIAGTADGGGKLQYVRLHKPLQLCWWKLWQRTRLDRCSQLCTQPSCLRCATRRSRPASLSSQGHSAPALLISGIGKRKGPSSRCSRGQIPCLEHTSQWKTTCLVGNKWVWTRPLRFSYSYSHCDEIHSHTQGWLWF